MTAAPQPELARRLTTTDAVVVGLSAMIGAGVFVVFAPAAAEAGSWLFAALALAALVALCNATSTAQLAIAFPTSGGAYVFGRRMLGPTWGFLAGWGFVVGKTASCAAMALTFASYAVPAGGWWARLVAVAAVVALTVANLRGVTRTARVASVLLVMSLVTLVLVLVVGWAGLAGDRPAVTPLPSGDLRGVLMAAGLLFFAFAGYARIATLAEEVRRPEMIGRAVLVALTTAIVLYVAVGATLVALLGDRLPRASAPVAEAVAAAGCNIDMIVQNVAHDNTTDFTFTVHRNDYNNALQVLQGIAAEMGAREVIGDTNIAKVSIVGVGMRSHAGVASRMFEALAKENINIQMISTSEIKVSVVIEEKYLELAVRALHTAFELDAPAGNTAE